MPTPNTDAYMVLGYAIVLTVMGGYSIRLLMRFVALHKRNRWLDE